MAEIYENVYEEVKDQFDIVFISCDRDQGSFDNYYNEMPWKALPFAGESIFLLKVDKVLLIIQMNRSFIQTKLLLVGSYFRFCETRSKRSVEVYRGRKDYDG